MKVVVFSCHSHHWQLTHLSRLVNLTETVIDSNNDEDTNISEDVETEQAGSSSKKVFAIVVYVILK